MSFAAVLSALLIVAALSLSWLERGNTDLQPLKEMLREARELYLPAATGKTGVMDVLLLSPAPGEVLGKRAVLKVAEVWDARVLGLCTLLLQLGGLLALFLLLRRLLSLRVLLVLCGILIIFAVSGALPPRAATLWPGALILLSILQLSLMSSATALPWRRRLGIAAGALNILLHVGGIAASAALLIHALLSERGEQKERGWVAHVTAPAALLLAGIALACARLGTAETGGGEALSALLHGFAWPFSNPVLLALSWAPALLCFLRWAGRPLQDPLFSTSALLALWSLLLVCLLAFTVPVLLQAPSLLLALGLLINCLCLPFCFPAALPFRRKLLLGSLWALFLLNALLHPASPQMPLSGPGADSALLTDLRRSATRQGVDEGVFRDKHADWLSWISLQQSTELQTLLPPSIRPPLALLRANEDPAHLWRSENVPALANGMGLPALGTRSGQGAQDRGSFVSESLQTSFPLLRIQVCGDLKPPHCSLVLRTEDGLRIPPLESDFSSHTKWKTLNFPAPESPFRIVAEDASDSHWLAFSAPIELGYVSWLAGKIPHAWPWVLFAGIALGTLSLAAAFRGVVTSRDGLIPPQARSLVPWLALLAYALFFSNAIDSTAGPNDSGGYLNSAKALAEGHLTLTPRMLQGPSLGETDLRPYLPTTFFAIGEGSSAPEYPVGFPLEIAALAQIMPLNSAVQVLILGQLVLGVLLTRALARSMGLPETWAWFAAFIVGLNPVYLFQALQPQSDGPAMVWVTAAVWLAWESREKTRLALLAGLATALAVLIRPSNLLCIIPLLVCFSGRWKALLLWAFAGLPGAVFLMAYNHGLYGHVFRTGYGDIGGFFALRFLPLTLESYARWLPLFLTPLALLGLAGPFLSTIPLRVRFLLGLWALSFLAFYSVYWCTYDNWYNMRFVLPAAPAMIVLALLVMRSAAVRAGLRLFEGGPPLRSALPTFLSVSLAAGALLYGIAEYRVLFWPQNNHRHEVGAAWVREHLPARAVVYAGHGSNSLLYYTDLLLVREDLPVVRTPEFQKRIEASGRPVYALLYDWELRQDRPSLPGDWERLATLWNGDISIWRRR